MLKIAGTNEATVPVISAGSEANEISKSEYKNSIVRTGFIKLEFWHEKLIIRQILQKKVLKLRRREETNMMKFHRMQSPLPIKRQVETGRNKLKFVSTDLHSASLAH